MRSSMKISAWTVFAASLRKTALPSTRFAPWRPALRTFSSNSPTSRNPFWRPPVTNVFRGCGAVFYKEVQDRKSTRLNSSHGYISYAVFCLKKQNAPHNLLSEFDVAYGDVAAEFARAPNVFRETLWQHRGSGHSIECRGAVAQYDPFEDRLT